MIVITVLITDTEKKFQDKFGDILSKDLPTYIFLYADDTLLIDVSGPYLEQFMMIIADLGKEYGLELNWKKTEYLAIRDDALLFDPDGNRIKSGDSITYLGALLSCDGRIDSELSKRLGVAAADFKALKRIWNQTSMSKWDKFQIFVTCVISKLIYGLQIAWLTKIQRRKLDGFYARSLRQILGIRQSFWSRVSNSTVLKRLETCKLSSLLLEQQLVYFGKVARSSDTSVIRGLVFQPHSYELSQQQIHRRRGRPRLTWSNEVYKHAVSVSQLADANLENIIEDALLWKSWIRKYCRNKIE